jgi:hypothetical protein
MIRISVARALRAAMVLVLPVSALPAQQHRYFSALEYSVAIPIGDTRDYISAGSLSGGVWEMRWMDRPHTSIGALVGFNEFQRRGDGTFTFPGGAATGDRYQHLLMVPILFTSHYYLTANRDDPRWFIGGGGGPVYTQQLFRLGLHDQTESDWGFVLVPEVGLAFAAWYGTGGILSLRYHLPTSSGDFLRSGDRRFQYVSLSVGLGFR